MAHVVHIAKPPGGDYEAPLTIEVMFCGATVVILDDDDASTQPPGFDFYDINGHWQHDPDVCAKCKKAIREPSADRRHRQPAPA